MGVTDLKEVINVTIAIILGDLLVRMIVSRWQRRRAQRRQAQKAAEELAEE